MLSNKKTNTYSKKVLCLANLLNVQFTAKDLMVCFFINEPAEYLCVSAIKSGFKPFIEQLSLNSNSRKYWGALLIPKQMR